MAGAEQGEGGRRQERELERAEGGKRHREEADPGCVWQGILLERRCLIRAEDCLVLSVGAGALARSPEIAATTALGLLAATTGLPVHGRPSQRIAAPYEAAALAQAMMRRITPVAA